jgi:hypothetical protein
MRGEVNELFIEHERLVNENLLDTAECRSLARAFLAARATRR